MSTDFTAPNKPLEDAIAKCKSVSELAEVLRLHQDKTGVARFDNRYTKMPQPSVTLPSSAEPQAPADGTVLLRRAVVMSDGTTRLLEAYSPTGLDVLERALRLGHI